MSAPTAGVLAMKVQNVADRKVIGRAVISVLHVVEFGGWLWLRRVVPAH